MTDHDDLAETEARLRTALAARADAVEPRDESDALGRITSRVAAVRRRRRIVALASAAAALAVIAGAVALVVRGSAGNEQVHVTPPSTVTTTTPTTATTTTTTTTVPTEPVSPPALVIWPFASSSTHYDTPAAAAKDFAVDYLGMTLARLGATTSLPNGDAEVEVFPNDRATIRTVVRLHDDPARGWTVLSAAADGIVADAPAPGDALTDPLAISGRGTAFEATIGIQLRPLGSATPVLEDNTMAGANGEVGPFSTSIHPPGLSEPLVLVLFEGDASGRGAVTQATVIPLRAG